MAYRHPMKPTILIVALLIAGCAEQAVERQSAVLNIDSLNALLDSTDVVWSACSLTVRPLPFNYQEMIDFSTWCQKAHPEVWREYHATHTGGE